MELNAETAEYVEIYIGNGELQEAVINCPVNSNYNGPQVAPCYVSVYFTSICCLFIYVCKNI